MLLDAVMAVAACGGGDSKPTVEPDDEGFVLSDDEREVLLKLGGGG